jgi:hypothetical protein
MCVCVCVCVCIYVCKYFSLCVVFVVDVCCVCVCIYVCKCCVCNYFIL